MRLDPGIDPTAEMNQPKMVWAELREHIEHTMTWHPRSQQKQIGPSELGTVCVRALAHKLNGDDEPPRSPALKPQVGTWCHDGLERTMRDANKRYGTERYLLERRVDVGEVNGSPVTGSCDLYDVLTGTVVDWKWLGKPSLDQMRRKGAKPVYRVQAHLYGRGYVRAGYPVHNVMIVGLPRDGELAQCTTWHEPYNEQITIDALARATAIAQLVDALGIEQTLKFYPECDDRYCAWCASPRRYSATPISAPNHSDPFAA